MNDVYGDPAKTRQITENLGKLRLKYIAEKHLTAASRMADAIHWINCAAHRERRACGCGAAETLSAA